MNAATVTFAAFPTATATKPRSLAGQRTEVQTPRGQELQAPRGQTGQHVDAREAIRQSEEACKAGNMTQSAVKARESLKLLGR
jgi:hypothetical protein